MNDSFLSHPVSTAVQIALVDLLSAWGMQPRAVIGHSSGEIAAAYTAGAVTLETAMTISYLRSVSSLKAKERAPEPRGAMLAVGLSQGETESYFPGLKGKVTVGCINSLSSVTVSGDAAAIDELQATLESKGVFNRRLKVETAYHSHHMTVASEEYRLLLEMMETQDSFTPGVTYWSSVTAAQVTHPSELAAGYWVEHMVSPVRFSEALRAMCLAQEEDPVMNKSYSVDILVEIGPQKTLSGPIRQILDKLPATGKSGEPQTSQITYVPTLVRNTSAVGALLETAATSFLRGYPVNLGAVNFPKSNVPRNILTNLPSYPWNHTASHWHETRLSKNYRFRKFPRHELLGSLVADVNELEPRWRNVLRLSEVPWLKHHTIQGIVFFPGAGYISMAIEAALQLAHLTSQTSIKGFRLRDLSFHNVLAIPDTAEGIETSFVLRPNDREALGTWNEFKVFSFQDNGAAIEHCRGLISVEVEAAAPEVGGHAEEIKEAGTRNKQRFELAEETCNNSLDVQRLYDTMNAVGLQFGEIFKTIRSVKHSLAETLATIFTPDTAGCMPGNFEYPHVIHTTTVDAVLQLCFSTGNSLSEPRLGLPRRIKEIYVNRNINKIAGHQFQAHAISMGKQNISVMVVDPALGSDAEIYGEPVIDVTSLSWTIIDNDLEKQHSKLTRGQPEQYDKVCSTLSWDLDVDLIRHEDGMELWGQESSIKESRAIAELERLALYYIKNALENLSPDEQATMEPHQRKLYQWMQKIAALASEVGLGHQSEDWLSISAEERQAFCTSIASRSKSADVQILTRVGSNLVRIFRKEVQPLELMLEDDLLYKFYREPLWMDRALSQMSGYLQKLTFKRPDINILEIGAGTGGTTLPIMQALGGGGTQKPRRFLHYTFTDISSGFFEKAKDLLEPWGDLCTFKTLDIEVDPKEQGFEYQQFDVIIASNVLHATRNMRQTLTHVRKLLKPGGKLLLSEMTNAPLVVSTVFGTLPGWWLGKFPSDNYP